jgi:hypothetical protein
MPQCASFWICYNNVTLLHGNNESKTSRAPRTQYAEKGMLSAFRYLNSLKRSNARLSPVKRYSK